MSNQLNISSAQLHIHTGDSEPKGVHAVSGGVTWWIPFEDDSRYYQEYLAWLAEGNEPLPADA